jgi:hypothetical protein
MMSRFSSASHAPPPRHCAPAPARSITRRFASLTAPLLVAIVAGLLAPASQALAQPSYPTYLDGSVLPGNAGWVVDSEPGQTVDLGGGNFGIRQVDDGGGYDEYYITIFDPANTLAARFRVDSYEGPPIQLLALTTGGGGPAIGLTILNRDGVDWWVFDRFIGGHTPILEVAPVVPGDWNSATIHIDTATDTARLFWNDVELFSGPVFPDWGGPEGYAEFGASNFWAGGGTSTVVYDWVGYGPGFINPIPEPATLTTAAMGVVALLFVRRRRR